VSQPNIVLIVADDLGFGDLGCMGNPFVRTPHLDQLARQGIRLTQHYSASPMCAPARAALLTGRYNHRTGAVDVPSNRGLDRIALSDNTIANAFRHAGYATGMVGKWHNGLHDLRYHPNARGFDEFAGFLNGGMDYWRWVLDRNGTPEQADGRYLTDVFTDEAVSFIKRHRKHPFFLYVAYNAPHSPLQAPEEDIVPFLNDHNLGVATLYGMIRRMDAGVGRILHMLRQHGLHDNTLVLFTSDNGPWMGKTAINDKGYDMSRFNGGLRGSKQDTLEGGIRVPALLHWPAGLPSGTSNTFVHFLDWFPTLLAAAGLEPGTDTTLEGRNVLPLLQGKPADSSPSRCWQWNRYAPLFHCNAAIRDGTWKLHWPWIPEGRIKESNDNVFYQRGLTQAHLLAPINPALPTPKTSPPSAPALYNLDDDPNECQDLAQQLPERVTAMTKAWDEWFLDVMADWRKAREENVRG